MSLPLESPCHLPPIPTPSRLLQSLRLNLLTHSANSHWLSIVLAPTHPCCPLHSSLPAPFLPPLSVSLFSTSASADRTLSAPPLPEPTALLARRASPWLMLPRAQALARGPSLALPPAVPSLSPALGLSPCLLWPSSGWQSVLPFWLSDWRWP